MTFQVLEPLPSTRKTTGSRTTQLPCLHQHSSPFPRLPGQRCVPSISYSFLLTYANPSKTRKCNLFPTLQAATGIAAYACPSTPGANTPSPTPSAAPPALARRDEYIYPDELVGGRRGVFRVGRYSGTREDTVLVSGTAGTGSMRGSVQRRTEV